MMVTTKTVYIAEDGKQFDSMVEAEAHGALTKLLAALDEGFVDGQFCTLTAAQELLRLYDITPKE